MNEKVLLYDDGCMKSMYSFIEDVVIIEQNESDDSEKNFVAVEIANIRRILLDYDLNHSKDEE